MDAARIRFRWALILAVVFETSGIVAMAATEIDIRPGPKTISAEEAAIVPDAANGMERGVILIEETVLDDAYGNATKIAFHRRAKILSSDGRSLADIEILLAPDMTLEDWWARTLLPDGRTLDVADKDVAFQTLLRDGSTKFRAAHIALRGVVPGSVIDYGYTITRADLLLWNEVSLERAWPTLKFRYRWKTWSRRPSAYRLRHTEGLDIHAESDATSVLITADRLPGRPREDHMPPDDDVRAGAVLYYMHRGERYGDFWNESAKQIDKQARAASGDAVVGRAVAAAKRAGGSNLTDRLRTAYEWVAENVRNPRFVRPDDGARIRLVPSEGPLSPLDRLYLDVARALGAEAQVVMAPNRDVAAWDTAIKTLDQLPAAMVALRVPGAPDDQALFVQLSSGLPFAEVPWWNSGVQAMLATSQGARAIFVTPAGPASNVSFVTGEQAFALDGSTLRTSWRRTSTGQNGLSEPQLLGGLSDNERRERVKVLCGNGPDGDVTRAEFATAYPPVTARLDCETERRSGADPAADHYAVGIAGPWLGPVPDLAPGPRIHPVVFDYPRIDTLEMTVRSRSGFRPVHAPEGASFAGSYGKYKLVIAATPDGYTVQRAVAMFSISVPPAEYEAIRSFVEHILIADRTLLEFERVPARP